MRFFITFCVCFLICALVGDASAFLGERSFRFNYRQADVKDSAFNGYNATERTFILGASLPVDDNVDVSASAQWGTIEGTRGLKVSSTAFSVGALYHFIPDGTVDPYIGTSYNHITTTLQTDLIAKDTVKTGAVSASTGAQILINSQISVAPQYSYTRYLNDDLLDKDSSEGSISATYRASGNLGLTVTYSYDFDDSSSLFTTGAYVSF